jgi:Fic family protein
MTKDRQKRGPSSTPESPARIEPCLPDAYPAALGDVVSALSAEAAVLGTALHVRTAASLAELVRVMNCYYSNLIEGHHTGPRDIERALANDLDATGQRRDLQVEARAHVRVQRELDEAFARGTLGEAASRDFLRRVHRDFYADAPPRFLRVEASGGSFQMIPGEFRREPRHDNVVGRHHPPSSSVVEAFMARFEERYALAPLGHSSRIVAIACAHHRLNYIHPFVDGNGRVSRLMSHAMALHAGVGAHGLWSISRGLARGPGDAGAYRRMMDLADSPRRDDTDGRGNLSLGALIEFATWFSSVALDQVRYMSSLFDLPTLTERLRGYVRHSLGAGEDAAVLAVEILRRGEIPRGSAARIIGRPERTARDVLRGLIEARVVASETPKGPVSLRFTTDSAEVLFPRLFPAQM